MTRKARKKSASGIYHIIMRGINKQIIFEDEDDIRAFIETLRRFKSVSNYQVFAYCMMDNHVHLLMKETEETISTSVKRISASYVFWYNKKYERSGHLFQERFRSENVETTAYFLKVLRYIHQNPLKAGLNKNVFTTNRTSIHEYTENVKIIDTDFVLQFFSYDKNRAIQLFIEFVQQNNNDECLEDYSITRKTDKEVKEYLHQFGVPNSSMLQKLDKESRNAILIKLKKLNGVTVRQLSRITGISKSVIDRIR